MTLQKGFTAFSEAVTKASNDLRRALPIQHARTQPPTASPLPWIAQATRQQNPYTTHTFSNAFLQPRVSNYQQSGFTSGLPRASRASQPLLFGRNLGSNANPFAQQSRFGSFSAPAQKPSTTPSSDAPSGGDPSGARGLDGTRQWDSVLVRVASESGVPKEVLQSIMGIETGGQNLPGNNAGAIGLMQVVPEYWQHTANQFGGNLSDPYTNIRTAAEILKQNYNTYGSWEKAAAAYFGGAGAFNPDGSYSTHADSYGTNITDYVTAFRNNMAALGYGRPSGAEVASGGQSASPAAQSAVKLAMGVQGTPYVWGGADTNGFDCSGLVQWAYSQSGKEFGRTAQEQYNNTLRIGSQDLQPGDLVFFQFPDDAVRPGQGGQINHVAIYIGNGQILQATSNGGVVKITNMNDDWYAQHIAGYGRVQ